MTVRELIKRLSELNQDLEVCYVGGQDGDALLRVDLVGVRSEGEFFTNPSGDWPMVVLLE